jgi:hypothetical protein
MIHGSQGLRDGDTQCQLHTVTYCDTHSDHADTWPYRSVSHTSTSATLLQVSRRLKVNSMLFLCRKLPGEVGGPYLRSTACVANSGLRNSLGLELF